MVKVTIEGLEIDLEQGKNLLEAIRKSNLRITSPCGGKGVCGKCLVKLGKDDPENLPSPIEKELLEEEDIKEGYRLACQVFPHRDVSISIPEESREATLELMLKYATVKKIEEPALTFATLVLPNISNEKDLADIIAKQVSKELSQKIEDRELIDIMNDGKVRIWSDAGKPVAVSSLKARKISIALDIGSTTMVVYGFDIIDQKIVSAEAMTNPQRQYGEDVMTRIDFSMKSQKQKQLLERVVRDGVSDLIRKLASKMGCSSSDVLRITFVGNTAMHHLFLGLDVTRLGKVPFSPEIKNAIEIVGKDIHLKGLEYAKITAPPLIAGFVGADLVAVLLATDLLSSEIPTAVIDIGTNAEIALACEGRLLCCSSAAGPAFEGGNISYGMRATEGAIIRVWSEAGKLKFETIGKSEPIGLCGSGLIDFVAESLRIGLVDSAGTYVQKNCGESLVGKHGNARYLMYSSGRREVSVTQGDIRQLQLAKAAMHAGLEILIDKMGIKKIDRLLLAGAFGANMSIRNGRLIGMFPEIPLNKIMPVGNAAGTGAIQLVTDMNARRKIDAIAKKAEHVELSLEKDFQKRFIASLDFPHQDSRKYPESSRSVKIRVTRGK
ncbi:MAG: ASKHA domain-containing protein [Thermoplasmata archaeon]|nr:ASKHA domain-containing protein [Thermoplasmata archaeon]